MQNTGNISAFDYQHIKTALVIAQCLAKDTGTDQDISRINYAMKLLEAVETSVYAPQDSWTTAQVAEWGAE